MAWVIASVMALVLVLALVLALVFGYQQSKAWSYAKTVPYVLSISLISETDVVLHIQYDYGYGYLLEHQQRATVNTDQQAQQVSISISAWKTLSKIRLFSTEAESIQILSMSLRKGKDNLGISSTKPSVDQTNVLAEMLVSTVQSDR